MREPVLKSKAVSSGERHYAHTHTGTHTVHLCICVYTDNHGLIFFMSFSLFLCLPHSLSLSLLPSLSLSPPYPTRSWSSLLISVFSDLLGSGEGYLSTFFYNFINLTSFFLHNLLFSPGFCWECLLLSVLSCLLIEAGKALASLLY